MMILLLSNIISGLVGSCIYIYIKSFSAAQRQRQQVAVIMHNPVRGDIRKRFLKSLGKIDF